MKNAQQNATRVQTSRRKFYHEFGAAPLIPKCSRFVIAVFSSFDFPLYLPAFFFLSVSAISCAACRARCKSSGANEIAATRACPPPPYFSHSEARFTSAGASFHGFVPTDTFARIGEALSPTV